MKGGILGMGFVKQIGILEEEENLPAEWVEVERKSNGFKVVCHLVHGKVKVYEGVEQIFVNVLTGYYTTEMDESRTRFETDRNSVFKIDVSPGNAYMTLTCVHRWSARLIG